MIPSRPVGLRRVGPAMAAAALLPALLAGCEAEAVDLAREIEAARGECTREGLRTSDEECVRMMERYTSMGTELIHTYLGGLRTLDMALDRMPAPGFDTSGVGYAMSPEFRQGDAAGIGGSPRLAPAYTYGYGPRANGWASSRSDARSPGAAAAPRARGRSDAPYAGGFTTYGDRYGGRAEYADRYPGRLDDRPGYGDVGYDRWRDRNRRGVDRSDRTYRGDYRADFGGGWYGGPGSYAPFGFGGLAPFDDWRYTPFGYGAPYGLRGYAPVASYAPYAPYSYGGYGIRGGYAPGAGWSGGGYDPYARYRGYDPYAPYTQPYADGGYGGYAPPGPAGGYDDRPPADAWGYDASTNGAEAPPSDPLTAADGYPGDDLPAERSAAPARPAPHRPGILLPPAERLRRPWLDD